MSEIPDFLLVHEVTIEPWLGVNGRGEDLYADPITLPAFIEAGRGLTRDRTTGDMVTRTATIYIKPRASAPPIESRITLPDGSTPDITEVKVRDGGGLPTPDHIEIVVL